MAKHNKHESPVSHKIAEEIITVRDCLRWATSRFQEAELFYGHGTESAWDEAVHLVLQNLFLPIDIDNRIIDARLTFSEREKIIEDVYRRVVERVPLPYLTHAAWFAGLKFYVDKRVIVPRSPVGELIRNHYSPWLDQANVYNVLDLCCGSGCIGIASSYVFQKAHIVLADLSPEALEVAQRNVTDHQIEQRTELICSDLFNKLGGRHFDLIVANPPYVNQGDYRAMPTEFRHEPRVALEAGENGLEYIKRILKQAPHHLTSQGVLIVEVGDSEQALKEHYPDIPFTWLEFADGGHGVFLFAAKDLIYYHDLLMKG